MHIEKLSVKDREVTVRLSADEIVKIMQLFALRTGKTAE